MGSQFVLIICKKGPGALFADFCPRHPFKNEKIVISASVWRVLRSWCWSWSVEGAFVLLTTPAGEEKGITQLRDIWALSFQTLQVAKETGGWGGWGGWEEVNLSFCFTHPSVSTFATSESSAEPLLLLPTPTLPSHLIWFFFSPLRSPPTRLAAERDLRSSSPISHALHPHVPSRACGSLLYLQHAHKLLFPPDPPV